ncbi:outer membrane protein assembly factor BamD [Pinisolibacter aquiterrae]|uniref:outer membrane protein assembly factor BamD n=1 Tax=Pinisolibacter aquiterrae TaxID=2815579 RepID=UPI001E5BE02C|nr:outer membrane protein assembly factor BamD [Pinisolibacter aquiterrae]MCC8237660.1 outer membrane protein assembly factor BamD [Pinisolibacter aquiterrae]
MGFSTNPVAVLRRIGSRGRVGSALALSLLLASCASQKDDLLENTTPADQLYNEGLVQLQAGKRADAVKKFDDVDRLHPYSEWSKKAVLMQAYTQFERGAYTDCITSAQRFITLYPTSPDAAYAQYLTAESYYLQIPDVSRDQARTANALAAYDELIQKYPTSPYAEDARKKILSVKDQLGGKEMDIGRFYLRKHQYLAAINRFKSVVSQYQTTRHVEEALARLVECYYAMGVVNEAQTAAAVLGHNFPDSPWYKDSYDLLKKGGYEPSEDTSSWISRSLAGVKLL